MELQGINLPFVPVGGINELNRSHHVQTSQPSTPFESFLNDEVSKLNFSSHARSRMESRGINLNGEDISKLQQAVTKAEEKGARDSLVMLRDMAFIVNIPSRTIVTALKGEQAQENVFTKIDSAVVA
jgi:flagellar operon protein